MLGRLVLVALGASALATLFAAAIGAGQTLVGARRDSSAALASASLAPSRRPLAGRYPLFEQLLAPALTKPDRAPSAIGKVVETPRPTASPAGQAEPALLAAVAEAGTLLFIETGHLWVYLGEHGGLASQRAMETPRRLNDHAVAYRFAPKDAWIAWSVRGYHGLAGPSSAIALDLAPDGRSGAYVTKDRKLFVAGSGLLVPELELVNVHWSPTGRSLALEVAPSPGTVTPERYWPMIPRELVLLDLASGKTRTLHLARSPTSTYGFPTFRFASWSPDDRYVAIWEEPTASNAHLDGLPLVVIDTLTGQRVDLGRTLLARSWLSWSPPHALAYAGGTSRFTFENKWVAVWSPEAGQRRLTGQDEVAISPAWAPDGRTLYFVRSPRAHLQVDPGGTGTNFSRGEGPGDRRLVALDVATGARRELARDPRYAVEAVRAAGDGKDLLVLRRPFGDRHLPVELWLQRADGSAAQPLVRLGHLGYAPASLWRIYDDLVWSR